MLSRGTLLIMVLLVGPMDLAALDFTITYGYRTQYQDWNPPPAGLVEGTVPTTIEASAAIDTAFTQRGLNRVDATTWSYEFDWDTSDSLSLYFTDDEEEVHEARIRPAWDPYVPGPRPVPVVVLEVDLPALWSPETGIYVWGDGPTPNWDQRGEDWERPATFNWYDRNGLLRHQRPIGLRIHGAWNRYRKQKSLRLYFDHHGEPTTIVDDFFGSSPYVHERLILRAGSSRSTAFIRDILATTIFGAAGHDRSRWTPVEVYFSDEYWGLYHLRERPDDEWAELTLGLSGEFILIKDGDGVHGDREQWMDFLDEVAEVSNPEDNSFYLALESELDLGSYLDWVLLQCWSGTTDNGGHSNLVVLRPEQGRWRFMAYDQDGSFSSSNRTHDYFSFFVSANEAEFEARRPPAYYPVYSWNCRPFFDLFRQAMANPRARRLARQRWAALTEQLFTYNYSAGLVDSMVAVQVEAADRQQERWSWSGSLTSGAAGIKSNIEIRHSIVRDQFVAFMDQWMDPVELDQFTAEGPADAVGMFWHTEREIDCAGWLIERRPGEGHSWETIASYLTHPDELVAAGGPDQDARYSFIDRTMSTPEPRQYRLSHACGSGSIEVHPWVETWFGPPELPALVINEFLASNDQVNADETGAFEDWVELYNAGPTTVSLDSLYLTDDLDVPLKWRLPNGLSLEPGGFLLVWCDNDPEDGPLHATFKLAAGGESVGLYLNDEGGVVVVDSRTFAAQTTDVSEGRSVDGGPIWTNFTTPTPEASNLLVAVADIPTPLALSAWPNPFNPSCRFSVNIPQTGPVYLALYDLAGRRVRVLADKVLPAGSQAIHFDGRNDRGALLASGVYHAVLRAGSTQTVIKVAMVR